MSEFTISAEERTVVGKKVKSLRNNGLVPGVIYGDDLSGLPIQMVTSELASLFRRGGKNEQVVVEMDGNTHNVIVKDLQRHITRGDLMHVDFQKVVKGQKIEMEATIELTGRSEPSTQGLGSDILVLTSVTILTIPSKMLSHIEVDAGLIKNPEDNISVSDLSVPEGVEILADPDTTIAKFEYLAAETVLETEDDLDPNAVEVISESDDDEDVAE